MAAIKFSAHKKFHLLRTKTKNWETSQEQLLHYRLVFVLSGEGKFILKGEMHSYFPQGVIFLEPEEQPIFQEDKGTEVFVISFDTYLAEDFQKKKAFNPDFADTYKQVENVCKDVRILQGRSVQNERDARTIAYLIDQILFELAEQPASYFKLIKSSIELVVTILARNNFETKKTVQKVYEQTPAELLVEYLKNELHQNKSIRVSDLLLRFNISEEVANLYTFNQTGISLRNFIFKYKSDLFKSRLLKVNVSEFSQYHKAG